MKTLLVEAQLTKASRRKDGSVNLSFNTSKSIETDEWTLMDQYWQNNGWLAFKINEMEASDIPTEDAATGEKSQSTQLRFALYAKHMQLGGTKEAFPAYYRKVMQGIIAKVDESYDR